MKLALWTYEGPPHVGAMRVAAAMEGLHYVLHAPQGDTYADLLFTMIERSGKRPPVTYTTFQARDLGGDTAELFKTAVRDAYERFRPEVPAGAACCGTAGDRVMLHPELVESATREEREGLDAGNYDAFVSANRTCEMGLQMIAEKPFESIAALLERASRPKVSLI